MYLNTFNTRYLDNPLKTRSFFLVCLILSIFLIPVLSQQKSFEVSKMAFSSSAAEDFAPVYYKNGLVYCSNAISSAIVSIKSDDENLYNILFVEKKDSNNFKSPVLFSPELTTLLNEGPATFSNDGNTIYYARNNQVEGKIKDINKPNNKLGIYAASFVNGVWTDITAFPYNNNEYSLGTPSLSKDGLRIYFASDMPGGLGGSDIYYCDYLNGTWAEPVNLGSNVNTPGDESYPYICESGRLFFSSNGHGGLGGKDIFYTVEKTGSWIKPVHLDADINSKYDDYGIITDRNFELGYFSSSRRSKTDIYSFCAIIPHFGLCDTIPPFRKCYRFYDERFTDTLHLNHEWDFGHGMKKKGIAVEQCFEKPGKYQAVLTIINQIADSVFLNKASYNFEVPEADYIDIEFENAPICNRNMLFTTNLSNSNNSILSINWNFGKGFLPASANPVTTFASPGIYYNSVGVVQKTQQHGNTDKRCFTKPVQIYADAREMTVNLFQPISTTSEKSIQATEHNNQKKQFYRTEFYLPAVLKGEISDSISNCFRDLAKYNMVFDGDNNVLPESDSILIPLMKILNENPGLELLIAVHVHNKGSAKNNQEESDLLSQNIISYYSLKGLDPKKFQCLGYGERRPLLNQNPKDMARINRRIEFILLNKTNLYNPK